MPLYGLHASHEQTHPSALLDAVIRAEQVGFGAAMCSDHFSPWSARQGQSGFAWAWLGAAMQATSIPFGVVNAPGQRYHPAVIAQAIATLSAMFPGRFWTALGTGEAGAVSMNVVGLSADPGFRWACRRNAARTGVYLGVSAVRPAGSWAAESLATFVDTALATSTSPDRAGRARIFAPPDCSNASM
ncbi:MAG TPA: LLM class flavin-dependent oxidoreductase [Actinokineospora sp.]|nr:LLM class flavin-dependent oxidoreductase [Actinokineospora sp.]